jgi:hypothetical protein
MMDLQREKFPLLLEDIWEDLHSVSITMKCWPALVRTQKRMTMNHFRDKGWENEMVTFFHPAYREYCMVYERIGIFSKTIYFHSEVWLLINSSHRAK